MFDKTFITPASRHSTQTTTVHEHRAPTDESVRLLRELESAADAKRIATMQMPGNAFKGVVEVWTNACDAGRTARAVFDLNGKRCTAEASASMWDDPGELIKALHEETSRVVARELLTEMMRGLRW
jgi:hypothetical protein